MSDETNAPVPTTVPRKRARSSALIWAHEMGVRKEIETIRRYLNSVTSSFAGKAKEYQASLEKIPDGLTSEDAESYHEMYGELEVDYIDRFPAFALETTFVATYAFLEDEMMGICRLVGGHLKIKLGPEELKDKGISGAKTYLEKVCGIKVPNDNLWQQAQHYDGLRNVFLHTRGRVKTGNKAVRQYVAANPTKLSMQNDRLWITDEFCFGVLDDVENLLNTLLRMAMYRLNE